MINRFPKTPLVVLTFLVALAIPAFANNNAAITRAEGMINDSDFQAHIKFLADDELKGRASGREGLRIAGAYAVEYFQQAGLLPMGEIRDGKRSFYQKVSMVGDTIPHPELTKLAINGKPFELSTQFTPFLFSGKASLENREAVFVGYGITDPKNGYDDYAGIDVKGKIAVVFRYDNNEATRPNYPTSKHAYFTVKAATAEKHGAAALVIINGPNSRKVGAKDPLFGLMSAGETDVDIPVIHAKQKFLSDLLDGSDKNIKDIQTQLDQTRKPSSFPILGKKVTLGVSLTREHIEADNIIGMLEGSDPTLKDEYVVVGAHYDHVGMGTHGSMWGQRGYNQIHNGADDNASGTAAVLELAQAFTALDTAPKRSILFMLYCGEERGLLGSRHYVENPTVPLKQITTMINADMIGRSRDNSLIIHGTGTAQSFDKMVDTINKGIGLDIRKKPSGSSPSDNTSFYRKGIPVLFYHTGLHDQYHTPEDDIEYINVPDMTRISKHMFRTTAKLANADARPTFVRVAGDWRPRLGVQITKVDKGLLIEEVITGEPAAIAGLEKNDVLVTIDGKKMSNINLLRRKLRGIKQGSAIEVTILRENKEVIKRVEFN